MTTQPLTAIEPPKNKQLILAVKHLGIERRADGGIPTHGRISLAYCYKDADSDNPQVWDYLFDPGIAKPNAYTYASLYLRGSVYYDPTNNPLGKKPTYLWMPHYKTGDYPITEFEIADMAATLARLETRTAEYQKVFGIPQTFTSYVAMMTSFEGGISHFQLPDEEGLPKRLVTRTEALYWLDSAIVSLGAQIKYLRDSATIDQEWSNITATAEDRLYRLKQMQQDDA